jgi:hypothetical protein
MASKCARGSIAPTGMNRSASGSAQHRQLPWCPERQTEGLQLGARTTTGFALRVKLRYLDSSTRMCILCSSLAFQVCKKTFDAEPVLAHLPFSSGSRR